MDNKRRDNIIMRRERQPEPAEIVSNIMANNELVEYGGSIPEGDEAFTLEPPIVNYHKDGIVEAIVAGQRSASEGQVVPLGRVVTQPSEFNGKSRHDKTSKVLGGVSEGVIFDEKVPVKYRDSSYTSFSDMITSIDCGRYYLRRWFENQVDVRDKLTANEWSRELDIKRYRARISVLSHLGIEIAEEKSPKKFKNLLNVLGFGKSSNATPNNSATSPA